PAAPDAARPMSAHEFSPGALRVPRLEEGDPLETFTPSIDWGNELAASVLWILTTWAICAGCVVVIAALLIRYTTWARRFWRVTGDYFGGMASVPVWGMLAILLLSIIASVRIEVLMSYQNNDLYSALQLAFQGAGAHDEAQRSSGVHGFWVAIGVF